MDYTPLSDKVEAILKAPAPQNFPELLSYMYLGYYLTIVNSFQICLQSWPLYTSYSEGMSSGSGQLRRRNPFSTPKNSSPLLVHFDPDLLMVFVCDALAEWLPLWILLVGRVSTTVFFPEVGPHPTRIPAGHWGSPLVNGVQRNCVR